MAALGAPETGQTAVLRLRGLPYSATEADVIAFFDGWAPIEVVLLSRAGRATGEAFVRLATPEQASAAREARHCAHMANRYIEVFPASEEDLAAAVKGDAAGVQLGGPPAQRHWVLRLRGLPFSAGPEQVLEFFGPEHVIIGGAQGVVLTRDQDGRPTGEAFVEVPSEAAQQAALTLHRARMGPRYIEIFVASKPDMQQALQRNRQVARLGEAASQRRAPLLPLPLPSAPSGIQPDGATLKLRGLPYSAGIDDITSWLADFHLADEGVKLMTKADRSGERVNTGIAFVRFKDANEAALAAAAQHRKMMGTRYIECIPYTAPQPGAMRPPRTPLMGGPALYPAPVAVQLPAPLPYGMPVGARPPYPPRGGVERPAFGGRGRGLEGGRNGGQLRGMGLPPALAAQRAYQQQAYQQGSYQQGLSQSYAAQQQGLNPYGGQQSYGSGQQSYGQQPSPQGRPPPSSPSGGQQQQMLPASPQQAAAQQQHQQFFMQQQMLQQQQQQQMAMRGMRPDWSPQAGGMPMVVQPAPLAGGRGGLQWYMPPPPGSDAGMPAPGGVHMAGSAYGSLPSTYAYGVPTSPYPVAMPGYVQQLQQHPPPPQVVPSGGSDGTQQGGGTQSGEAQPRSPQLADTLPGTLSGEEHAAAPPEPPAAQHGQEAE